MLCLFHKWDGCKCTKCGKTRDKDHNWDLCKGMCLRCQETRPQTHDWNGCKCKKCGTTRATGHKWNKCKTKCLICGRAGVEQHTWDKCKTKCTTCGKVGEGQHKLRKTTMQEVGRIAWMEATRCLGKCEHCNQVLQRSEHVWNGCRCFNCGKTRDEEHIWNGCKCSNCNKTRDEEHSWEGCQCTRCGKQHDFVNIDICKFKCSLCGKVAIKHEYFQTRHAPAFESQMGADEYKCLRCGHRDSSHNPYLSFGYAVINSKGHQTGEIFN